jgi:hypothetical protein
LAALGLLATSVACSGNQNFGDDDDDSGNPGDDGSLPGDDGGTADTSVPPTNAPLVDGLSITNIAVLQAVEVTIVKNATPVTGNAPVVVGRPALVRVFVQPTSGWQPHAVTGVLTLTTGGQAHTFTTSLSPSAGGSSDATLTSTFNFDVDAPSIGADTTYLVQLKDTSSSGNNTAAQFPTSGTARSLGAQTSGVVKINVYPILFSSGGGTPATDSLDVAAFQQIVQGMYPVTGATLTVESPITYTGAIPTANGSNWSALLSWFTKNYRATNAEADLYYYGAFAPATSFESFCGGGCVAGLSNVPSGPTNYSMKASIGLTYGGNSNDQLASGQTMTHEVGHGHGREHSPTTQSIQGCSTPSGLDPSYPYANGAIGVLGYDPVTKLQYPTSQYYDIMGYCAYDWISDYTYSALFDWIAADNGADIIYPQATTYRWLLVGDDGSITDQGAGPVNGIVSGTPYSVVLDDGTTVTGFFTPFDHLKGGQLLVPEPARSSFVKIPKLSPNAIKITH